MTDPGDDKHSEAARIARLHALRVLDTESESLFDALTRAAALVVGAPISLVSLIDTDRQWFKSNLGLPDTRQTPRDMAFCAHAIASDELMEVRDALSDDRFANNPLVAAAPHIRFYAGAPIVMSDGLRMGTLCVIDRMPRELSPTQRIVLKNLASAAADALDQRLLALESAQSRQRQIEADMATADALSRLRAIVDGTRAGSWEWNIQTGETRINARWAQMVGYTVDELGPITAQTWAALVHPDDLEKSLLLLKQHFRGDTPFYDNVIRLKHKDGHWIWVHSRGKVASWSVDGRALWVFGTHLDITTQKNAERRLHESEAFLDRTGRLAGVGGWEVDLATNAITWSDETCRIHEVPVGHRPTLDEAIECYAPEAREVIQAALQRGISNGTGWDLELPLTTASGREIWVRTVGAVEFERGVPIRMVGAFQDVTVRRRAVRALELSEQRFRKLFESSMGLICTHDLDGILLSVNPAAARSLGYSMAELLGRSLSEITSPTAREKLPGYMARIVRNGKDSGLIEFIAKDESIRTWEYHNVLDRDDDHRFVLGHAQDITERKQHEQKLLDLSIRDPLTGCFNRRYLTDLIATMADSDVWGCIVIDLDHFKHLNDTLGHAHGDDVLVAVARHFSNHIRPQDVLVRTGGDEFLILLKDADEMAVDRVVARLGAANAISPTPFSLGHAVRHPGTPLKDALAEADKHLYELRVVVRHS